MMKWSGALWISGWTLGIVAFVFSLPVLVGLGIRLGTVAEIRHRPEIYLAPFQFLQAESQAARLLILGTARLLDYVHCAETAQLQQDPATRTWEITLPQPPTHPAAALQGLTIYTDSTQPVRVRWAGGLITHLEPAPAPPPCRSE